MTKQDTMMVIEYYNTMKSFSLELDYYQDFKMQCSDDVVVLKKNMWKGRVSLNFLQDSTKSLIKCESKYLEMNPYRHSIRYSH
jgi:hypothetical protein